jgi:hypothetical protein
MISAIYASNVIRVSLLAVLFLSSPVAAFAECAWVLWYTSGNAARPTTSPTDGYSSKVECEEAAVRASKRAVDEYKKKNPADVAFLSCLPDSVDPRGPKGR